MGQALDSHHGNQGLLMNRRLFVDARPRPRAWVVIERLVITLWVGGLWAIGYLAVPVLFHALDDRAIAGNLAGEMFRIVNGVGLVCGVLLLASTLVSAGAGALRRWRSIVVIVMMTAAAVILFVLQPQMAVLKAEAAAAGAQLGAEFGRLHGISSALYLVASVLGVFLVASGPQGRER